MVRLPTRLTPAFAFAAGVITVLLAGAGVAALAEFVLTPGGSDYNVTQVAAAPGGARRALLFTQMGGGAAGWCDQRLVIDSPAGGRAPSRAQLEALPFDSVLFKGSCGSNIRLAWRSPTELQVGYTLTSTGVSTYQRPATSDGAVRLRYVIVGE